VGANRTATERTPRSAYPRASASAPPRGAVRTGGRRGVGLGRHPAGRQRGDAGGEEERAVGALEDVREGLDGGPFGAGRPDGVGEVVVVAEVDDAVGGRGPQHVEVGEAAAQRGGAEGLHRGGGRRGPGQAGDVVAGGQQRGGDRGADPAAGTGDEDVHEDPLPPGPPSASR